MMRLFLSPKDNNNSEEEEEEKKKIIYLSIKPLLQIHRLFFFYITI